MLPILALTLAMQKEADTWDLKSSLTLKTKLTWAVKIDASAQGMDHHAAFNLNEILKSDDAKKRVETFSWDHLVVDDQDGQEVPPWDAIMGMRGEIVKMDGDVNDDYRRMLSPFLFVYPEKPVAISDKWTFTAKPDSTGPKITYSYEAKKTELVKEIQTIVLAVKYGEEGKDGSTGEGMWWVSRAGRIIKFEIKIKNWTVPIAGGESPDATIKGQTID